MTHKADPDAERARAASVEDLPALLHDPREEVLAALLENPHLDESHLCLLLERKELSSTLLEALARRKDWMASYRIKRRLAFHVHAPRLLVMRLARELYLMDLVQLSLQPAAPAELKRLAEELILARLPQLPLGQKITLARRGSARVAGGLLAEGHPQVVRVALDNGSLTEAQVLRALARETLPAAVVSAIAHHPKWSHLYNVRVALVRHPLAPLARVLAFLPELTLHDLRELGGRGALPGSLRHRIREEIAQRSGRSLTPRQR
jgi:hypothetical protein